MATGPFVYQGSPQRVVFGSGMITRVAEESTRIGISRALVLSTPEQHAQAEAVAALLGAAGTEIFAGARMHTPVEVTDQALAVVTAKGIDGTIAIGGGSTTGLGKTIAVHTDLPQIVIPTTYAGSEMTNLLGATAAGEKTTRRDPKILPETVIYDVDLTLSLPPGLFDLDAAIGAPTALRAIGMPKEGLDRAADLAAADPYYNPRPLDRDAIRALLDNAWHGRRPV